MTITKDIGQEGESLAINFLVKNGHQILFTNWRYKQYEVDIITKVNQITIFTEVKTRSNLSFGEPFHFVDKKKQKNLLAAANAYCFLLNYSGEIRFDIISIYKDGEINDSKIEHIEDAFYQYR